MALCLAMRCTPTASTTDRIAGNPSGTAATASATPSSRPSMTSRRSRGSRETSRIGPHDHDGNDHHGDPQHPPDMSRSPLSSGVDSSCGRLEQARRCAPISVSMPVAVTTARPVPCTTAVPLKTMFGAVAQRRGLAQGAPASFSTASLSPVSEASCTRSDAASHQPRVGSHGIAFAQHEHVAAHQFRARNTRD